MVAQPLPTPEVWATAHEQLASVFGVTLPTKQVSGFAVERAGIELVKAVDTYQTAVDSLVERLDRCGDLLGVDEAGFTRLHTAIAAQTLLADLAGAGDDLARVEALAAADIPTSALALSRCITLSLIHIS